MTGNKIKQITANEDTFAEFERLANSYGMTNKALLAAMVNYFKITKADPRDPKADNPTDAIKALDKRLIGFIRQQEKTVLGPIREAVLELAGTEGASRVEHLRVVNTNVKRIIKHLNIE